MIHKACMPVYMNSGKIVADGTGGRDGWTGRDIEGSTRGPRGPKKSLQQSSPFVKTLLLIYRPVYFWHIDVSDV